LIARSQFKFDGLDSDLLLGGGAGRPVFGGAGLPDAGGAGLEVGAGGRFPVDMMFLES